MHIVSLQTADKAVDVVEALRTVQTKILAVHIFQIGKDT